MGFCGCVLATGLCWDFTNTTLCRLCIGSGSWPVCTDLSHENRLSRSQTLEGRAAVDAVDFMHRDAPKDQRVGLYVNVCLQAKYRQVLSVLLLKNVKIGVKQKMQIIMCTARNPVYKILFGIK